MSFSLYDRGNIIRREATLDSLIHKPALHRVARSSKISEVSDSTENRSEEPHPAHGDLAEKAYGETLKAPGRKPITKAQDIMSAPVVTMRPDNSLRDAFDIFVKKRFRHLPITDSKNVVGIISDRDILRLLAAEPGRLIEHSMTHLVLTANPMATIRDLASVMFKERIGSLPVVSETHDLLGIVTRSDILRALVDKGPIDLWI